MARLTRYTINSQSFSELTITWFRVTNSASMAAKSPSWGVSAKLRGVNVAGDWTGRIPLVSVRRTERSNWDMTEGRENVRDEEKRRGERERERERERGEQLYIREGNKIKIYFLYRNCRQSLFEHRPVCREWTIQSGTRPPHAGTTQKQRVDKKVDFFINTLYLL